MTPLHRARIRVRMAVRHRPFWIEMFAGKSLAAWGIYVLLMPIPLGHLRAFALLRHMAHANAWVGGIATGAGIVQVLAVLANLTGARIACTLVGIPLWCFAALVTRHGTTPHPGTVLYAEPIAINLFALAWLIYDVARRR